FVANALPQAIGDARLVEVVGRHLHLDAITDGEPDETFAHFAGDVRQHLMFVVELDAKHGARQHRHYVAFHFNVLFHESSWFCTGDRADFESPMKNPNRNNKSVGYCRSESHTLPSANYPIST